MDTVDLAATKDCHCLSARRKAREITRFFDEYLRPHGLRSTQFSVLAALHLRGPSPLSKLADLLGLERTTLTRSTTLLERKKWIERTRSSDARERLLVLAPAGYQTLLRAFPAWEEAQRRIGQQVEDRAKSKTT